MDGVAYLTSPVKRSYPPTVRISALRLADSTTLWNTPSIVSGSLQISGDLLLSSGSKYPHKFIEIVARDRRTGELLWRWSTPRHIIALLWLWGRNIPLMIAKAINEARWTLKQRGPSGRGRRRRDVLWHEFLHGQWLRPTHLIGLYTVAGSRDAVYVGTSLDLFAIDARTGKRRWHALPTMHIAHVVPAPLAKVVRRLLHAAHDDYSRGQIVIAHQMEHEPRMGQAGEAHNVSSKAANQTHKAIGEEEE